MHADVEKYKLPAHTYYMDAYPLSLNRIVRLAKRISRLIKNFSKNPDAALKALDPFKFGKEAILLRVFNQIWPFLDKGPYDIVHCQFGPLGELGLLLRDTGVFTGKIITSFRGYDISAYVRYYGSEIYHDLFRRGDLFLCVSERIKEKLIGLGCDEGKIVVHRSGVDTQKCRSRARVADPNGAIKILTVARLAEKKGVEYGIRAVSEALKKSQHVEYKIAGDGPLKGKLQSLIAELKVGDKIELVGWKSQGEIADLLEKSDILLAPSVTTENGDEEGIPGVIMEAFAHGLPVVSTCHAGIPEVVKDGESGFLVPERDVGGLAEKLQSLIAQPGLRAAMGQKGRDFVNEHYNIEKLNDRLVEMYKGLSLGESPSMAPTPSLSAGLPRSKPVSFRG